MVSNVEHTQLDKRRWLGCDAPKRQEWNRELFVAYPAVASIISDLQEKLDECERTRQASGMFVAGGSGVGKTTLMNRLKAIGEQRYARQDDERTIRPVLLIEVPDPCTPIEFSYAILEALGDPDPRGRKHKVDTHKAAELFLTHCEVRLILIDNVQDIPARRAKRGVELVSTRLRQFMDKSFAVWVFLGTQEAKLVINSDPQIVKRVGYRAQLDYFSISDNRGVRLFSRVLEKVDAHLPLAEASCLVDPKTRARLFLACDGIFDRLIKLVDRGWYEAFKEAREQMTRSDLERAFAYVHGQCRPEFNPFSDDFVLRQLHRADEPFEILRGEQLADSTAS
jgi:Bacterial TniB protein